MCSRVPPRSIAPCSRRSLHMFPRSCVRPEPPPSMSYSARKIGGDMPNQLLATKSIDELHEGESKGNQLTRALSATALTLPGIGGIIGTGISVLTGAAAANHAGPALALSFIV